MIELRHFVIGRLSGQESFILFTHFIIFIAYLQGQFDTLSHIILMLVQHFFATILKLSTHSCGTLIQ